MNIRPPFCECGELSRAGQIQGSNGVWLWGYFCWSCLKFLEYKGCMFQTHIDVDLDVVDVISWPEKHVCGWCKEEKFCEKHHYWPREFFGDDAEKGPVGWLCMECHDLWHRKLTGRSIRKLEQETLSIL